ncbi:HlyD family secretion protein [Tardiphaga sp. 839_C3_N1_4]|uniref:HlyD family secretion protein n=1 Tax=Tardiphaga sp. 839_C3_N1_4 TaxID=3240761 RepID=UPI003F22AA56
MGIVAILYVLVVWLLFVKLKWLRWGWGAGIVTVLIGIVVCAIFAGFLSYLAPTARVVVISRVVEVTPNVSGPIVDVPVKANELVKADAVLFKIDPTPFEAQVRLIEAQLGFQDLRLAQMKQLQAGSAGRAFDVEERQSEVDQLKAQLDKAKYDLDQTTIRAPADGYVASLALSKGDRATSSKAALSFVVSDAIQLIGIFSQNGYQTIKPGVRVQFALSNNPGHLYSTTIGDVVSGVGEGQIAASGAMTKVTSLPMTSEYPALINRPKDIEPTALRPGMSGTATAYAPNSAPFDFFGWALLYGRALALYL